MGQHSDSGAQALRIVTRIAGDQKRFRCRGYFEKSCVLGVGKVNGQRPRSNRIADGTDQLQEHRGIFDNDTKLRALQHAGVLREDAVVNGQLQRTVGEQVDDPGACAVRCQDSGDEHVRVQHHPHRSGASFAPRLGNDGINLIR
jgi:hypothetical protein